MAEIQRFLNSVGRAQQKNLFRVQVLWVLVLNLTLNIFEKSPRIYMHQLNYHMWDFRLSFNRLHKPTDRIRFIFVTGECSKALKMQRNLLDKYSVILDGSWQNPPLANDDQTLKTFPSTRTLFKQVSLSVRTQKRIPHNTHIIHQDQHSNLQQNIDHLALEMNI